LRTADLLWDASRVFFNRWGLSPSQFNVLNLLHERPEGLSQSELSRALIMHRSNATGMVDRLERRGLVMRLESDHDRRAWRVVLTEQGCQLLDEILPDYYRIAEDVWGRVEVGQANAIEGALEELGRQASRMAKSYAV
jgi:MarR family 2-MHQ and catechol resistance regulon transcriptional repressor